MGVAGPVELLCLLPKQVGRKYEDPNSVLSTKPVSSLELRSFPVFVGAQTGKYAELVPPLERVKIVHLSEDARVIWNVWCFKG